MSKTERITICPKDIQRITGKSESGARKELGKIKKQLGKQPHQYLTIREFCHYTGLDENQVLLIIGP
ncbi:hypothetical protein FUAX_54500 (plasmid) [Fulvitalea axinellae]|uniref:Uncharacterized protein n=1 Tax=Fulvitalea axinellae TaxID=1182444 RepID=A0AAU9CSC5_9BACT|nr:hypothetical protein FUAX_54500 [Fulvitalea axinellae]